MYMGGAAFCTYLCMYAFRKPFTVATFEGVDWNYQLDFKTCLLIAQVIGYAASKFIGIKVISEMTPGRRTITLVGLIAVAEFGLLLLPVLPPPYTVIALFINGLPLGMIWGLVFSFLEGRRITEAVGAILCACFIFGSGVVKSVGKWLLLDWQIPELWMPFVTGLLFFPPLLFFVWALSTVPPPDAGDIGQRHQRVPMKKAQRRQFFKRYAFGITLLVLIYMVLTGLRDFTDNFAAELWIELGYGNTPSIFTTTSIPISLIVLAIMFSLMAIRDNVKALLVNHCVITLGLLLVIAVTALKMVGMVSGLVWFLILSTGLYMAYIPFNCILFDRLVACSSSLANAGFLIYLADAFGYLASIQILLYKSFFETDISWVRFTEYACLLLGLLSIVLCLMAIQYFYKTLNAAYFSTKELRLVNEQTI